MLDASHWIARNASVETTIIGSNMCDIQMTYNVARTIHVLTDCISMQWRHFNDGLRIELPRKLGKWAKNNFNRYESDSWHTNSKLLQNICCERNKNVRTWGGGEPVATHLNEICWPGRTLCSMNVDVISGVMSAEMGMRVHECTSDFKYSNRNSIYIWWRCT